MLLCVHAPSPQLNVGTLRGIVQRDSWDCKSAVPDHELLQRIGIGAYGEVWLARNVLDQLRAVKIVHRNSFTEPRPFEREFEGIQRFEPLSRSHPSQLAILHVGKKEEAGYFYYVMELADLATPPGDVEGNPNGIKRIENCGTGNQRSASTGDSDLETADSAPRGPDLYIPRTLRYELDRYSRLSITDCIQIGLALTTALAHLHRHALVHRDIKPSNVIFVNGVPKLGDIGLVTEVGDTQSIVGTEGYLPPEGPGTPQADIFSLGKVLYEISTGLDRRRFAELPEDLRSWPDRTAVVEFNEILLKACAKDPERRYQSAEGMRVDLELLQQGRSIKQKRTSERCWKAVKTLSAAAALFIVIAGALALSFRGRLFDTSNAAYRLSKNPLAKKEYNEGVRVSSRDTSEGANQGLAHFRKAVELDPKFTMAYNGMFEIYIDGSLGDAKRRAYAKIMLELDSSLAEAHAAQGWIDFLDWKWDDAEQRFKHALKLNPKCAIAQMRYGFCRRYR